MKLSAEQFEKLLALVPELPRRPDGRGRPWRSNREVLPGILHVLTVGCRWSDLPKRYPPYQTCHRRYQRWVREGVWERIWLAACEMLEERGRIDTSECCYLDATFARAKKGARTKAPRRSVKGRN